jgi:hypothetical protein
MFLDHCQCGFLVGIDVLDVECYEMGTNIIIIVDQNHIYNQYIKLPSQRNNLKHASGVICIYFSSLYYSLLTIHQFVDLFKHVKEDLFKHVYVFCNCTLDTTGHNVGPLKKTSSFDYIF